MKKVQWYILCSIVLLGSVACGKKEEVNGKNQINISIGNASVAGVVPVIAKEAGLYQEEGLEVIFNVINVSTDGISALTTGKVDVIFGSGTTAPLRSIEDGSDLIIIGGVMSEGAALVTLPNRVEEWGNITQRNMTGKKIGVTRAQSGDIAFRTALVNKGIDLSTIEFVELNSCPTIIEAVKKGTIDVGIVFMTNRVTAQEQGLEVALHIDEINPGFTCCRLATTRQYLNGHREQLVKLIRAHIKAYEIYKTEEEKTVNYAKTFIMLDDSIIKQQIYEYGHLGLSPNPDKKKVMEFYQGMKEIGYVKGTKKIENYIDISLFEEALNSLLLEEPKNEVYQSLLKEFKESN